MAEDLCMVRGPDGADVEFNRQNVMNEEDMKQKAEQAGASEPRRTGAPEAESAQNSGQAPESPRSGDREDRRSKKAQKKADDKAAKKAGEDLGEKISDLEAKLAKEKDDYLRLMAEFDNFRRRTAQDRLDLIGSASADVIRGLLPILDDFERALKVLADSSDSDAAKEGTQLIYTKLMDYLKTKGLAVIKAAGEAFDTDLHEAVAQFPVEDAGAKGKVFDVVQTGYTLGGKVIRFAKVVVGI